MVLNLILEPKMKVMTRDDFIDYYEAKYGDKEIKLSKRLKTLLVFVFANLIWLEKTFAKPNISKLNDIGNAMLSVVQDCGYWVLLILCLVELIKTIMAGDTKSAGRVIVKYLIGFSALYFIPFLFDMIKEF